MKRKSRKQQYEDKCRRDPIWAANTILRLLAKNAAKASRK
jgi:transcription elongation factor GreA-like protein